MMGWFILALVIVIAIAVSGAYYDWKDGQDQ